MLKSEKTTNITAYSEIKGEKVAFFNASIKEGAVSPISINVTIPKKFLDDLMFEENELVEVKVFNGSILIQKAVKKYTDLDELFEDYTGNYKCSEYDFGEDMGREKVW